MRFVCTSARSTRLRAMALLDGFEMLEKTAKTLHLASQPKSRITVALVPLTPIEQSHGPFSKSEGQVREKATSISRKIARHIECTRQSSWRHGVTVRLPTAGFLLPCAKLGQPMRSSGF